MAATTTTLTPSPTVIASLPTICVPSVSCSPQISPAAQKTYITSRPVTATSSSAPNSFRCSSFFTPTNGRSEDYPGLATRYNVFNQRPTNTAARVTSPQQQYGKEQLGTTEHSKHGLRSSTGSSTSSVGFASGSDSPSPSPKIKRQTASPLNFPLHLNNHRNFPDIAIHNQRNDDFKSATTTTVVDWGGRDRCNGVLPSEKAPRQALNHQYPHARDAVFIVQSQLHRRYQPSGTRSRSIITATAGADAAPVAANVKIAMASEDEKAQAEDENGEEPGRLENGKASITDKPDKAERTEVNVHEDPTQERDEERERLEGRRTTAPLEKQLRTVDPVPKVMPIKYETCDVHDLGFLIADMLMELVRLNDGIPLKDGQLTRFHSRAPPSISFRDYLIRLIVHATLSPPLLLSMVFYIDRLCALYPAFTISSLTVHRFLITAATVAAKGLGDSFWTNSTYARVGGVSVKELALLELELLKRLEWRIVPKPEVLVDYYKSLVERSNGYVLEDPTEIMSDTG